jgi:hypothetical protein
MPNVALRRGFSRLVHPLLLVLVALLAACDLEVREQRMEWRHVARSDELHVLFLHTDVGSEEPAKGAPKLLELVEGRREFMLVDWPLHADIDAPVEGAVPPLLAAARARFSIANVRIGVNTSGATCGSQHLVIRDWSGCLNEANAAISRRVLAECNDPRSSAFRWLDEPTQQLWRARAEQAGTWLAWDEQGLYFDLPASPRGLALLGAEWAKEAASTQDKGTNRAVIGCVVDAVERLEPLSSGVRIRIGHPTEDGWSVAAKRGGQVRRRDDLRVELARIGALLPPWDEAQARADWLAAGAHPQR